MHLPFLNSRIRQQARVWVVPAFYMVTALILSRVMPAIDRDLGTSQGYVSPATALNFLSAIASGMITFTGIVFSMAIGMVQFGSNTYSPRIASYLLYDRVVKHALGMFIATFLYALNVSPTIDAVNSGNSPTLTVLAAMGGVLGSAVMFLALLQRISVLQVTNILQLIGERGRGVIKDMYPPLPVTGDGRPAIINETPIELPAVTQTVTYHGRIAAVTEIDVRALRRQANRANAIIEVEYPVGDTIPDGATLLRVRGGSIHLREVWLRRAIKLGALRSIEQDPKYAIRIIVDIAIRALSPAINDPTTAVQAIDQLDDLLRRIGTRQLDVGYARTRRGVLRVIYPTPHWEDFVALAIDEIRYYGAGSVQVMRRLQALVEDLHGAVPVERQAAVKAQQQRIIESIQRSFVDAIDRQEAMKSDRQGIGMSQRLYNSRPAAEPSANHPAPDETN